MLHSLILSTMFSSPLGPIQLMDIFFTKIFTVGMSSLAELIQFFDSHMIDGITNSVGAASFFMGESIKYMGGGRVSSYLFLHLSYVSIFLLIFLFYKF